MSRWNKETKNSEFMKESNGFLDCMKVLEIENAGRDGQQRVCQGKVYDYSLRKYKEAYENICDAHNRHATYQEMLNWMDQEMARPDMDPKEQRQLYQEEQTRREMAEKNLDTVKTLVRQNQAEYENACDDMYYGYSYQFWRTHGNEIKDDNIAKIVWEVAFNKMAGEKNIYDVSGDLIEKYRQGREQGGQKGENGVNIQEAVGTMVIRTKDLTARSFSPEQREVILPALKEMGADGLIAAAQEDPEYQNICKGWREDTEKELHELEQGITREQSQGMRR